MSNSTLALVFVLILNVLMWFSQVAMLDMNPSGSVYYHCEGSILEGFGSSCSNASVINTDVTSQLPSSSGSVSPSSSNIFTDIFNNILSWIKSIPGVNYIYSIASAPVNILKSMGLPNEFSWGLGIFWYGLSIFIILSFLWGRE